MQIFSRSAVFEISRPAHLAPITTVLGCGQGLGQDLAVEQMVSHLTLEYLGITEELQLQQGVQFLWLQNVMNRIKRGKVVGPHDIHCWIHWYKAHHHWSLKQELW